MKMLSCCSAYVGSWHFCEVLTGNGIVCLSGQSGSHRRTVRTTRHWADRACVGDWSKLSPLLAQETVIPG